MNAQDASSKVSNGAKQETLVAGHPVARSPSPTVGNRGRNNIDVDDRRRAIGVGRPNEESSVAAERLTFVLGVMMREIMGPMANRDPGLVENQEEIEGARGEEGEAEAVAEVKAEPDVLVEEPKRRRFCGKKRKLEMSPDDVLFQPATKKLRLFRRMRFSRRVEVEWAKRELAISERRPYCMTGRPVSQSSETLRRPSLKRLKPATISRSEIDRLAAEADPGRIRFMENPAQERSCVATCGRECGEGCMCREEGIECGRRYGCRCDPTKCPNWAKRPLTLLETIRRQIEATQLANEAYEDLPMSEASTISSVGSGGSDEDDAKENSGDMVSDETDEADIAMNEGSGGDDDDDMSMDWDDGHDDANSTISIDPLAPSVSFSPPPPPSAVPDSPPSSPSSSDDEISGDEDSSSSSSDDNGVPEVTVNLDPENYSQHMLDYLPMMLDQADQDSCQPQERITGDALFVGLLRVATEFNLANKEKGLKCAVLHSSVFEAADELAKEDQDEKERRLLNGVRGRMQLRQLGVNFTADRVVFGNGWTDMLVPMFQNGNHWSVCVVRRCMVQATIYDSLLQPLAKDFSTAAIKKVLSAIQMLNANDRTTGRFKVRYALPKSRDVQVDGHSCGVFVMHHARRALVRKNFNVSTNLARGDVPINILEERRMLWEEVGAVREFFLNLAQPLAHGPQGMLPIRPEKVIITVKYVESRF